MEKKTDTLSSKGRSGIGKRIREFRKKKGLTLVELGKKLNISHAALSGIETGKSSPSTETLMALFTKFTDINIIWLIFGVGEMIRSPVAPGGEIIGRLAKALGIVNNIKRLNAQDDMAKILSITREVEQKLGLLPGTISPADLVDPEFNIYGSEPDIIRVCMQHGISIDWVFTGKGPMHRLEREKPPLLNLDLLIEAKESVEKTLQKKNIHLSLRKRAALEALLYDELIEDPSKKSSLKERIVKFIKLQK